MRSSLPWAKFPGVAAGNFWLADKTNTLHPNGDSR